MFFGVYVSIISMKINVCRIMNIEIVNINKTETQMIVYCKY